MEEGSADAVGEAGAVTGTEEEEEEEEEGTAASTTAAAWSFGSVGGVSTVAVLERLISCWSLVGGPDVEEGERLLRAGGAGDRGDDEREVVARRELANPVAHAAWTLMDLRPAGQHLQGGRRSRRASRSPPGRAREPLQVFSSPSPPSARGWAAAGPGVRRDMVRGAVRVVGAGGRRRAAAWCRGRAAPEGGGGAAGFCMGEPHVKSHLSEGLGTT